jgi:hypothetical protein
MLAKHKVVGSTPITRSIFKPLGNQGLFLFGDALCSSLLLFAGFLREALRHILSQSVCFSWFDTGRLSGLLFSYLENFAEFLDICNV